MTSRTWKALALHCALAVAGVCVGVFANAEMILDDNVMVTTPYAPTVESLGISAVGKWSITIADLGWPQALQSLSFAITGLSGALVSHTGAGTLEYNATAPIDLFANVYAIPNSAAGVGLYHINVTFTPAVPLPAAGLLLLSGILGLAGVRRAHATVTNPIV